MLGIQVISIPIGRIQDLCGIAVALPSAVDFQFHAEIPEALAVENRLRLIVIVVNYLT